MIGNINILYEPVSVQIEQANQVQLAHEAQLVKAHRRGEHPYGSMRRDCPLCQLGK